MIMHMHCNSCGHHINTTYLWDGKEHQYTYRYTDDHNNRISHCPGCGKPLCIEMLALENMEFDPNIQFQRIEGIWAYGKNPARKLYNATRKVCNLPDFDFESSQPNSTEEIHGTYSALNLDDNAIDGFTINLEVQECSVEILVGKTQDDVWNTGVFFNPNGSTITAGAILGNIKLSHNEEIMVKLVEEHIPQLDDIYRDPIQNTVEILSTESTIICPNLSPITKQIPLIWDSDNGYILIGDLRSILQSSQIPNGHGQQSALLKATGVGK